MKMTDQTAIDHIANNADEVNDGFFAFCSQGHRAIEMVKYSKFFPALVCMYQITVHTAGDSLDFTELSQFTDKLDERYTIESTEYYSEERTAYARLMALIAEHNGF